MGSAPASWLPSTRLPQVTAPWKIHATCTRVQMALRQTSAPALVAAVESEAPSLPAFMCFFSLVRGLVFDEKPLLSVSAFASGGFGLRAIAQHG